MATEIRSYEDLEVWKRGIELAVRVSKLASQFPAEQRFELASQLRRAAVSVPSNIAEGHARRKPKPYLNHVHVSLGSLAEVVTCLIIARRLQYVAEETFAREMRETAELGRMLHGLAASLERRIESQGLPLSFGLVVAGLSTLLLLL